MWQYQKLSTLFALGLVAISTTAGCATSVEDPVVDEQEMSADNTSESSEALATDGGKWGGFKGFHGGWGHPGRGLGWGRRLRHGFLDDKFYGYGHGGYLDYGYGGYLGGYGYPYDYGYGGYDKEDINIFIEQNNGYVPGGYIDDDYLDYGDDWGGGYIGDLYDDCGDVYVDEFYGDDWK